MFIPLFTQALFHITLMKYFVDNIHSIVVELCSDKYGWDRFDYAQTFDASPSQVCDNVPRVDATQISKEEFIEQYERPYKPVVVINGQTEWDATRKWTTQVCIYSHFNL